MEKDIQEILLTEEQIKTRIAELGKELTADYAGKDPIIVGVLKGVVVFYADMIREIKTHCEMDFMWISPMPEPIPPERWRSSGTSPRISRAAMC